MIRTAIHLLICNIPCLAFAGLSYFFARDGMPGFAIVMVVMSYLSLHTIKEK